MGRHPGDRELGMGRPITRRDFVNGVAAAGAGTLASAWLPGLPRDSALSTPAQDAPGYYPPALTGMRGSADGSFETAHALRDGDYWTTAPRPVDTKETYDLVVVGGGISGLAAAYFYRRRAPSARILVLDNNDDFGGHARRDEFRQSGRLLLANGGTWAIESPFAYSAVARGLLAELGIDPPALAARCNAHGAYPGLSPATFFDREAFGADRLVAHAPDPEGRESAQAWRAFLGHAPLSAAARRDILRIQTAAIDYMPGESSDMKKDRLSRLSYRDYLLAIAKADPSVLPFYQTSTHDLYGVGIDAVPALDCWALSFPGFQGLALAPGPHPRMGFSARGYATPKEPYQFHFPDGNASVARMLVRSLVPGCAPGRTAEDIVTARMDYGRLDRSGSSVRIRLNSTVVRVAHGAGSPSREVEVAYAGANTLSTVRARGVVMACWNAVIPHVCPDLPEKQKDAMRYGVKVPLVYSVVAIRNGEAFQKLGVRDVSCPGMYHTSIRFEQAVRIGGYASPTSPKDPMFLNLTRTPCAPGLPEREQHRAGRFDLLSTSFETFERNLRDQLGRVLGAGGFDPARDIQAITVNRWPHGYAYEYNSLFDPDWPDGARPCDVARQRFGRIAIANSDAAGAAYTDLAIDEAWRAVQELTS